jgi:hypothetical protein
VRYRSEQERELVLVLVLVAVLPVWELVLHPVALPVSPLPLPPLRVVMPRSLGRTPV